MNYKKEELKKGITIHKINTNKFKTNLFAIFLTTKLDRENVTKNALLVAVLRRGTQKFQICMVQVLIVVLRKQEIIIL